jgi:hypothetical protein
LVLYDDEACYGATFLFCYIEDVKNIVQDMLKQEAECRHVPIQAQEWKSLGSDTHIQDLTVKNTRKQVMTQNNSVINL